MRKNSKNGFLNKEINRNFDLRGFATKPSLRKKRIFRMIF